jgi:hypothetical protein
MNSEDLVHMISRPWLGNKKCGVCGQHSVCLSMQTSRSFFAVWIVTEVGNGCSTFVLVKSCGCDTSFSFSSFVLDFCFLFLLFLSVSNRCGWQQAA